MGSNISSILAILYTDILESQVVTNFHQLGLYKRYADNVLLLTTDREAANQFFELMNKADENIKFEIEHPKSNNSLSLLDFTLNINSRSGQVKFCFYKKASKKNTFPHANSALPLQTKHNIIRNEANRIEERCTDEEVKKRT